MTLTKDVSKHLYSTYYGTSLGDTKVWSPVSSTKKFLVLCMADVLSKEQRQKCMSNIRSKNSKPELLVREFLFANGFRYRLYRKDLPGKPDIVLSKYKTVIFINGCFWHGHKDCKYAILPETNPDFWEKKISGNVERDTINISKLNDLGWRVIEIWQCQLKPKAKEETLNNLIKTLRDE